MKTASGVVAVQVAWSSRRGSRSIEHLGSAYNEPELAKRVLEFGEKRGRLSATRPRDRTGFVRVEVLGDDHPAARFDECARCAK